MAERPRRRRVLAVFGTRPEAIKLAPLVQLLRANPMFRCRVCVTGQHRELLQPVLRLFDIIPDVSLDVMTSKQTPTSVMSRVVEGVDGVLDAERPDVVLVHGDTTTTLAAALAAFHRRVPIAHVEAGLRTGDMDSPFPEEGNRRLTGALAKWHFAATAAARDHLLREGVHIATIAVTGNTVVDALRAIRTRIANVPSLAGQLRASFPWLPDPRERRTRMILVTAHRRENFGAGLRRICAALVKISRRSDVEIVWPVHPNPMVAEPVRRMMRGSRIRLIPPQDYVSFVYLMMHARIILTDSGGVQEEAPSLRKPVLVMRAATERPEAVRDGAARMVGTRTSTIVDNVMSLLDDSHSYEAMRRARHPFGDGHASQRIERALFRWM